MIVRILEEGQFDVPDSMLDELNALDSALVAAIDGNDETAFRSALSQLLGAVRDKGKEVPDDYLGPSELILPHEEATIDDVKELLTDEGLIPD